MNLAALDEVTPSLAGRLREPVDGGHVLFDPEPRYRIHRTLVPLDPTDEPGGPLDLDGAQATDHLLVLGTGAGPWLEGVLDRAEFARISLWERDPWLLRLVLMRLDLSAPLRDGTLTLALGADLLDVDPGALRLTHPLLGRVYAREIACLDGPARRNPPEGAGFAVVCAGGLFVDQLADEFERRGLLPWTLDAGRLSLEELDRTVERLDPRLIAAVNYTGGLAELAARHGTELLCWEIDPTTTRPRVDPSAAPAAHVFTWRRANVPAFEQAGFPHVVHHPLAADPAVRRPLELTAAERERYGAPVAFVGSSLVANAGRLHRRFLAQWCAWRAAQGAAQGAAIDSGALQREAQEALASILAAQRADFSGFRIPALLEEVAPGLRAWVGDQPDGEDPVALVGEVSASEKRLSTVASLGSLGAAVWGDAGWELAARHGVDHRGPAGHGDELTRIYNATTINVDVGRLYQSDIVTMRTFDVLACGAFALVEHSAELEELFEVGVEVESYRSTAELREKAAHYLAHPAEARAIAERGRRAVLERHTVARRVEAMLGALRPGQTERP